MVKNRIIKHLEFEGKDIEWLSRKSGIPVDILNGIFIKNTHELTQERLNLINIACKTNFELYEPAEKTA